MRNWRSHCDRVRPVVSWCARNVGRITKYNSWNIPRNIRDVVTPGSPGHFHRPLERVDFCCESLEVFGSIYEFLDSPRKFLVCFIPFWQTNDFDIFVNGLCDSFVEVPGPCGTKQAMRNSGFCHVSDCLCITD